MRSSTWLLLSVQNLFLIFHSKVIRGMANTHFTFQKPYFYLYTYPTMMKSSYSILVILQLLLCCFISIIMSTSHVVGSAGECEVCVKVMDDVKSTMSKEDSRNKPAIELALGEYCANHKNTLNAKEKKICYYIDPIKRDVAQPFSLGMPSLKVCQRINKTNPEICSVKLSVQTEKMEKEDITKLRVKQLKQILSDRGVECIGCVEKEEFVKRVQETEHLARNHDEF